MRVNNMGVSMEREKMVSVNKKNSTPVRILYEDNQALAEIKAYTGIPVCKLIHMAIPLLRRKYKIKSEDKGE